MRRVIVLKCQRVTIQIPQRLPPSLRIHMNLDQIANKFDTRLRFRDASSELAHRVPTDDLRTDDLHTDKFSHLADSLSPRHYQRLCAPVALRLKPRFQP